MPHVVSSRTAPDGGLARNMPMVGGEGTQCALIHDRSAENDRVAVVYDRGDTPPHITVTEVSDGVQAVHADGVSVAVIACAMGPRIRPDDVVLVERFVTGPRN